MDKITKGTKILTMLVISLFVITAFSPTALAIQPKDLTPQQGYLNTLLGNPLRIPLYLGEYNTGLIITKKNPIDSFWYICEPISSNKYTHQCKICNGCD